jgi:hypothetical protein
MESIAFPPSPLQAEGPYGLSWKRIFKLRDSVARRFYCKFQGQIPLQEFLSEGNQALTESLASFPPDGPASLPTWLYRHLVRRMWRVPGKEWKGANESRYAHRGKHAPRLKILYRPPHLESIPNDSSMLTDEEAPALLPQPLTTPATQEALTYLSECFAYVTHRTGERERTYLWHSLDGEDCAEIGRHQHRHKSSVQRALHQVRDRLTTWSEEVSCAAAAD